MSLIITVSELRTLILLCFDLEWEEEVMDLHLSRVFWLVGFWFVGFANALLYCIF